MDGGLPLQFEQPLGLLLLLLIIPALLIARRSVGMQSPVRASIIFFFRVLVILLITMALAHPNWEQRGEGLTVTVVLDRSHSIPMRLRDRAEQFLREASEHREPEDRLGSIIVGRDSTITAMPDRLSAVTSGLDDVDRSATNLAAGLRLALALAPEDTANRIVIASDGNETIDSVLAAAELARANNVPVDVLPLEFSYENEVLFERIMTPARARQGQTVNVRMVLRSQREASGTLYLRKNDEPLDLDPDEPGMGRSVELSPGVSVFPVTIRLDDPGPAQFSATFEPDSSDMDTLPQNNHAMAVTFVTGEGRILVLEESEIESANLVRALRESDLVVDVEPPQALTGGLVFLSAYDAVILANVPRWAFDDEQDRMLHAYVHDLGGGLIMLGGPESFGAGGWIDSETARVLPVRLDPPQTRQMPRGALTLVMHSCEMPQGNYWGQEVARAAINALSRQDYVGIVEYDWRVRENQGATWAFPIQVAGNKQAAIAATRQLVVGDTKDFGPLLRITHEGMQSISAGQKHVIIISDGDPQPPPPTLLRQFVQDKITITTVMVIGHGSEADRRKMQAIAETTGGRFYHIMNPTQLPQIFIKEAQLVSRSLIQEGELFQPQVVSRLPGPVEGYAAVPAVEGYVLTALREGLSQTPIVLATSEGEDPIFAHWNYGLGKSLAYTSDVMGRWGERWATWSEFKAFWTQAVRWSMRPSSPANFNLSTRLDGDRAIVEVEALDADASFLNFLRMRAAMIQPDGSAEPLGLQQVGPGRYRGEFEIGDEGAYLINVNYAAGAEEESQGNLQAAVTVPYSQEYRAVSHNAALLRQLAEMTGGRVLSATSNPADVLLYDRAVLEVPRSPKAIWDLLAILAAILFLFDVASRRLAIDGAKVLTALRRAVGRREEVEDSTVEAWKKARGQVSHRKPTAEKKDPDGPDRSARFEASEEDAASAIDVGAAESAGRGKSDPNAPSKAKSNPADAPPPDEGEYTSRLLAAKRRARQQKEEDPGADDGGGGKT